MRGSRHPAPLARDGQATIHELLLIGTSCWGRGEWHLAKGGWGTRKKLSGWGVVKLMGGGVVSMGGHGLAAPREASVMRIRIVAECQGLGVWGLGFGVWGLGFAGDGDSDCA